MKIYNFLLAILIVLFFLGCSEEDTTNISGSGLTVYSEGETSYSSMMKLSGTSYKGKISSAVIEIYDFSNNVKGPLLSSGTVIDSKFEIENIAYKNTILMEIKSDSNNTASYIDEDSGSRILFNNLILKAIIENPLNTQDYTATPLTTFATELVLSGSIANINIANQVIAKLFGLSFENLSKIKPNIEEFGISVLDSHENEYALSLLSIVAFQNEIDRAIGTNFTIVDMMNLIQKDLSDGIFDGKEGNTSLTVQDGNTTIVVGDIPKKLSQASSKSLSEKNPMLLSEMQEYFLRSVTASRVIQPPTIEIKANENIRLNEKSIISAEESKSPFGYPLTYSWTLKNSPLDSNASFSSLHAVNTFFIADTEGLYTVSLEISDGHNSVTKDINITADFDGDGVMEIEDLDVDGDGILNAVDKFSNNPAEFLDSDNDGNGNFSQKDEDGDGILDEVDEYPYDNTKSSIVVFVESEFNGNLNEANILSGDMPYKISGAIYANGSDDDYFKFNALAGTIVSISLHKTYENFEPIISVVDSSGNSLPSINSIVLRNTIVLTFRIPIDGAFSLIITDKNSYSSVQNLYIAKVYVDSDMDGVPDDYERAIGSNENSSDSDADGIKDYYEIYVNSLDIDSDSIPNWLDHDSDADTIPDSIESLTDYDNDGLLNPYDIDSDGNGIFDSVEVGTNPLHALDTDGDDYFDYTDRDDDNDGLLDINDNSRLVVADVNSSFNISLKGMIENELVSDYAQSSGILNIIGNNFTTDALVVLVDMNGVYNLIPSDINNTNIKVSLPNIEGITEVKVYDNGMLSTISVLDIVDVTDAVIFNISYPNGQAYALENDTVTLYGINLSGVISINVNGIMTSIASSTNTSLTFRATNNLSSGLITASTLNGDSNALPILVGREVSGTVVLPQASNYDFSNLKIEFAGIKSTINPDGTFSVIAKNNDSSSITIFTLADDNGSISVYLSALVLSTESTNVIVNSTSTAVDIIFSSLNAETADQSKQQDIAQIIKDNIDLFSKHLEDNLGANPYYISLITDEYITALSESKTTIYDLLKSNFLIKNLSISRSIFVAETSGFTALKDGNPINGKVTIENDTMIFADYKIKNIYNGKIIKSYVNEFYHPDLLGPQYSGFYLYLASSATTDVSFRSSKVTVVTPKFRGMTFYNFNKLPEYKLAIRTLISQGFFPIVNAAIGMNMSSSTKKLFLEKIFIPAINGPSIDYWQNGEIGKGFYAYGVNLLANLRDDAVKEVLKSKFGFTAENIALLITKLAGFAVPTKAVELAGTAVDLGWTVYDFATVDDLIDFNIIFPITVEDIYPTSIKKSNSVKRIYINGKGLENYCSNYDWVQIGGLFSIPTQVCVSWNYPKAEVTSFGSTLTETASSGTTLTLELVKKIDEQYYFDIPASFIENASEKISVKINHVHNDEQQINELIHVSIEAPKDITIVDELSITNITPNSGGTGVNIIISGAGFSTNSLSNKVYFTTESGIVMATVINSSESLLEVQVPKETITGNVWVEVDTEVSNNLTYTVSISKLTITFGDNGSANDDTFALEFDGKVIKTMTVPTRAAYGDVELSTGRIYTVKLKGITAPDDIGTYYISFPSEIEVISGDNLSGGDLTAGVVKSWQVQLSTSRSLNRPINQSITYTPSAFRMQAE